MRSSDEHLATNVSSIERKLYISMRAPPKVKEGDELYIHYIEYAHKHKTLMKITLNENIINFLREESGHRFSRCEAFEFLYIRITESEDKTCTTSCNRLAKEWGWDNHVVNDFMDELVRIEMLSIQRNSRSVELSFSETFYEMGKGLEPLFSVLIKNKRKASKAEAFFYVVQKIMSQESHTDKSISCRSLATQLKWSHHTVVSFLEFMKENNVISQNPSANGSLLELRWTEEKD